MTKKNYIPWFHFFWNNGENLKYTYVYECEIVKQINYKDPFFPLWDKNSSLHSFFTSYFYLVYFIWKLTIDD